MPSIDRGLLRIFDEERSTARVPDGVLGFVTQRATRRRAGRLAGATIVALGVASLAATTAISLGHEVAPAVPPETILGTVTLPFDSTSAPVGNLAPLGLACGDPAPTPVTRSDGIEWDVADPPGDLYTGAGITTTLRTTGGDTLPASVSLLGFVFVRGGEVAGWTYNSEVPLEDEYRYLDSLSPYHLRGTVDPWGKVCPGHGANETLAPGDYEWYPVVHVTASPETAAREWLKLQGYSVPSDTAEALSMLAPGSWDCGTFVAPVGTMADGSPVNYTRLSALCAPPTLAGVILDREARTITLPYTAALYTRSLEVTLVGDPLSFTQPPVNRDSSVATTGFDETPPEPVADTSGLACGAHVDAGANFATGRTSVGAEAAAFRPGAGANFENGSTLDLWLLPPALPPTWTVSYPDPLRVWFFAEAPTPANGLIKMRGPGYTVIGSATAVVNEGAPLALERVEGPTKTPVDLSAIQWCSASDPATTTVVAFEGLERVRGDDAAATETIVFDFWGAGLYDWHGLFTVQ